MRLRNRVKRLCRGEIRGRGKVGRAVQNSLETLGSINRRPTKAIPRPSRLREEARYTLAVDRGSGYLQIGEAANRAGLTQRTLRYYEELGLLMPASRMEGGFRLYSSEDMERIDYIKNLRDVLGFSLAEIRDMVDAEDARSHIKSELQQSENFEQRRARLMQLKEVALRQMRIVNEKRQRLKEMKSGIQSRIDRVDGQLQELMQQREAEAVS
jgi:MerR family transcriptional regulator, repressor of the yfmOP operon